MQAKTKMPGRVGESLIYIIEEGYLLTPLGYTPSWQVFVLTNYLYYSSLIMHFINFSHKVFQTDPEVIVKIFSKVCPSSYISFGGYYSTEASDVYYLRVCCNND